MNILEKITLRLHDTIESALAAIGNGTIGVAIVFDENKHLLGIVTDGDIRRGLLKHFSLDDSIDKVMNKSPITISPYDSQQYALALMQEKRLFALPVVNDENKVVDLVVIDDILSPPLLDNWVVLMAGGLGTRLRPLTDQCPKPLLKINDKPLLEITLENFVNQGFRNFFISVNYKSDMVKKHFGDGSHWGVKIQYLEESEPLGTAGALSLLLELPTKPILVMNGDIMTQINFRHLLDFHQEHKAQATLCVRRYQHQIPYGVVKTNHEQLVSIEEKPVSHCFVNAGIYVINPEVLNTMNHNAILDMPNLFTQLLKQNKTVVTFPIHEYWLDIGRIDDFNQAHNDYQEFF